jgi:hypothetical protein
VTRAYCLVLAAVPEDEQDGMRFSEGAIHIKVCTGIRGEQMECAAMLINLAADVQRMIKGEVMKGSDKDAA